MKSAENGSEIVITCPDTSHVAANCISDKLVMVQFELSLSSMVKSFGSVT